MKQTRAYETQLRTAKAVPFFKSRWGLLTLLAAGSGLYLYQRRGGSVRSIFSRVWDVGLSARNSIGTIAPSASDTTGDVGTFGSESSRKTSSDTSFSSSGI